MNKETTPQSVSVNVVVTNASGNEVVETEDPIVVNKGEIYGDEKDEDTGLNVSVDETGEPTKITMVYDEAGLKTVVSSIENAVVKFAHDLEIKQQIEFTKNGVIVDGNNYKLKYVGDVLDGKELKTDYAIAEIMASVTIRNLEFVSPKSRFDIAISSGENVVLEDCKFLTATSLDSGNGKRGLYFEGDPSNTTNKHYGNSVNLTVTNCQFDNEVYAFNSNNENLRATFTECELNGWLSGYGNFTFNGCGFGESGGYQNFIPYGDATFNNCGFIQGFKVSLRETTENVVTLNNCKYNNTLIHVPNEKHVVNDMWDLSGGSSLRSKNTQDNKIKSGDITVKTKEGSCTYNCEITFNNDENGNASDVTYEWSLKQPEDDGTLRTNL